MFYGCEKLPHYGTRSDDVTQNNCTYAYPDNGETGYFTPKHPVVTLNTFEGGHYENEAGEVITSITGDYNDNVAVKVILDNPNFVITSIKDNVGTSYTPDTNNKFIIPLKFNGNTTVTISEPYAVVRDSATYNSNGTNDLLEFRCDLNRNAYTETFDCIDTGTNEPGEHLRIEGLLKL